MNAIGYPPIHIHHMHVTSSQSLVSSERHLVALKLSAGGTYAIEFDVHGDRQCFKEAGGMNCTIRAYPAGYGVKLSERMGTFFDLQDVRPAGSPDLQFYGQHMFRWTSVEQRLVGKMLTLICPNSFGGLHDDYILDVNPALGTVYLYWLEQFWPMNATMAHIYFHAHHEYTEDIWAISASAESLGLMDMFGARWNNLTASGLSVSAAQDKIRGQIATLQQALPAPTEAKPLPRGYPALRCALGKDRWEKLDDGSYEGRYVDPRCEAWEFQAGEEFVMVSFMSPQSHAHPPAGSNYFWVHSVLYGLYVQTDPSDFIPNSISEHDVALGFAKHPYENGEFTDSGPHAAWWP